MVLLQAAFGTFGEQSTVFITVISPPGNPVLFIPLRRRIQQGIDRRGCDVQKSLEFFAAQAFSEVELASLTEGFLHSIRDALQPERITLWPKKM